MVADNSHFLNKELKRTEVTGGNVNVCPTSHLWSQQGEKDASQDTDEYQNMSSRVTNTSLFTSPFSLFRTTHVFMSLVPR